MFPIGDANPTRRTPILTWGLIAINVLVFISQLGMSQEALFRMFQDLSIVPRNVTADPFSVETALDFLRSMFFHGGFDHIIGNMLYLYLFGDNVEDRMGEVMYLVLYFVSGIVAGLAQVLIDPTSTIPLVGASGAIAGILGSYLLMFPNVRVRAVIPLGYVGGIRELPAFIVLGFWFVLQLVNGFASLGAAAYGGGVAFFAHIGGFVAGAVITFIVTRFVPQPPMPQREQMLYDRARRYRV